MLAPRKTLWSTPPEVIDVAIEALKITPDDKGEAFQLVCRIVFVSWRISISLIRMSTHALQCLILELAMEDF